MSIAASVVPLLKPSKHAHAGPCEGAGQVYPDGVEHLQGRVTCAGSNRGQQLMATSRCFVCLFVVACEHADEQSLAALSRMGGS
jgi:hypothetical protein